MIADIVAFWLAGSRDSPDRASDRRDWWYRGGPAADEEIRARFGALVPRACAREPVLMVSALLAKGGPLRMKCVSPAGGTSAY